MPTYPQTPISPLYFKIFTYLMVITFAYCICIIYYNIKSLGGLRKFLQDFRE